MQQRSPFQEQDSKTKSYYTTIFQQLIKINENQFSYKINNKNKIQQNLQLLVQTLFSVAADDKSY